MSKKSEHKIALGFNWAEGDRYSQATCELHPLAKKLAACLEEQPFHHVPTFAKEQMKEWTKVLFNRIPVSVLFVPQEPYNNLDEMQREVRDKKVLRIKFHSTGHVLGRDFGEWRAVHDYYGHALRDAPFSLSGELEAFATHMTQFPPACWPFIRSNVVLENAYRLNRGAFLCYPNVPSCPSKLVFDVGFFGEAEDFYHEGRKNA